MADLRETTAEPRERIAPASATARLAPRSRAPGTRAPAIAVLLLPAMLAAAAVVGQQDDPAHTEVWEPEPAIVDPGGPSRAPGDAIVLFDGTSLAAWRSAEGGAPGWRVEDGTVTVVGGAGDIVTRRDFGDVQLHLEWRTPAEVVGDGQGRGNSGVFLMERYEVQILDSFDNRTYSNGQAASIYKQFIPQVNASRGPGQWQSYDIVFEAPRFDPDGELLQAATMTVLHNGVLAHHDVELLGNTVYIGDPAYEAHPERAPLRLQDHGNPVSFRNLWVRELPPRRGERHVAAR